MPFLPVVERELRVAARDPKLWWRRGLVTIVALGIFFFVLVTFSSWMRPGDLGQRLFSALGGLTLIYAMVAGPVTVADALSSEKREGTLGLLFLTDLRTIDIVAGKTAAFATDHLLVALSALPVLAISFLLGGLGLAHFGLFAASLFNILFLSLSISLCVSAGTTSSRVAFMVSFGLMAMLTIGYPISGELLRVPGTSEAYYYMFCPSYSMYLSFEKPGTLDYWRNFIGVNLLAWISFGLALVWTHRSWRNAAGQTPSGKWQERLWHWNHGSTVQRKVWRFRMINTQPIAWLMGRNWLQPKLLWSIILVTTGYWFLRFVFAPGGWPDADLMVLWPMMSHYIFCVWLASEAPRQLADDKHSGALELLLCTPLSPKQILQGNRGYLWRLFGRALVFLCLFYMFNVLAVYVRQAGSRFAEEIMTLAVVAALVIPLQARSIIQVGLYEGLRTGNSLRATVLTLIKAGVLPWVLFVGCILFVELARLPFPRDPGTIFGLWGVVHLSVLFVVGSHAERRLRADFRILAGCAQRKPWWQLYLNEKAVALPLTRPRTEAGLVSK